MILEDRMEKKNKLGQWFTLILLIVLVAVIFWYSSRPNYGKEISITQVQQEIELDEVVAIYAQNGVARILYKEGLEKNTVSKEEFPRQADAYFKYTSLSTEIFSYIIERNTLILQNKDNPDYEGKTVIELSTPYVEQSWLEAIMPYMSLIIMVVIAVVFFRMISNAQKGGSASGNGFVKNKTRIEKSTIKFSDVAGLDEEKQETREIVDFLQNPEKYKKVGARIPKGILLVGPPGTGKTLLAKAVAGESNVPFFSISGSDFVELYVGVGAARVRDLFDTAKRNAPCVIFIDEIDAVGRRRGAGLGGGNDEREQTLNQLLIEMDGFTANEGVIVLAATNRADVLDPALLRGGRFDRQITVNYPDVKGRESIMRVHAKNKPIDESVDFGAIARLTSGFAGSDIENFLNEAAILAARDNRLTITMEDISEAIHKVALGPQKRSHLISEKDKRITAYHESGHAILSKLLKSGNEVHEVSIIPRGHAGGYTSYRSNKENEQYLTYEKLCNEICSTMGGRIAEELTFGEITTGASGDIKQATDLARRMITEWGMSKNLGFASFSSGEEVFIGRDYQTRTPYGEDMATKIDQEVQDLLSACYHKAYQMLKDHQNILQQMAELLLEKETIYSDEVDMIFDGKTNEEIIKFIDQKNAERKEKEDKIRAQAKQEQEKKTAQVKYQAAIALHKAGILSDEELEIIKKEHEEKVGSSHHTEENTEKENMSTNKVESTAKDSQVEKQETEKEDNKETTTDSVEEGKHKDSVTTKKKTTKTTKKNDKKDKE